jgi:excisionase family DNA binding protein
MVPQGSINQLISAARRSRRRRGAPITPPGFSEKIALEKSDIHTSNRGQAPLLTSKEVANWLGVSPRTVCLWAELGEMPGFKLGHQWRFAEAEVRKWLKARLESIDSGPGRL